MRDALGVIQPVYRQQNAQPLVLLLQLRQPRGRFFAGEKLVRRYTDRQRLQTHRAAFGGDIRNAALQAEQPQQGVAEMLHVYVGLKGDQVGAQQTFEHGLAAREQREDIGGRKRDVQEETDAGAG